MVSGDWQENRPGINRVEEGCTHPVQEAMVSKDEKKRIRVLSVKDEGTGRDVAELTPGERMGLMWQLAVDAWTFKGEPEHAESRLQRHVVRVRRGGG